MKEKENTSYILVDGKYVLVDKFARWNTLNVIATLYYPDGVFSPTELWRKVFINYFNQMTIVQRILKLYKQGWLDKVDYYKNKRTAGYKLSEKAIMWYRVYGTFDNLKKDYFLSDKPDVDFSIVKYLDKRR